MQRTFTKVLKVVLTQAEIEAHAVTASKSHDLAEKLKAEARELTKIAKDLDERVATGREDRDVECHDVMDFNANEVRTERLDEPSRWPGGEGTVDKREMTSAERQTSMPTDAKEKGRGARAH